MTALPVPPPLAIYLHFPWCVSKCPYCDFNSYTLHDALPETRYLEALDADLAAQRPGLQGRTVHSVFMGGGTPSLFSPAAIAGVIDRLRTGFSLAADAEITLEANPGTIERGRFAEYRAAGVNRVSLGAQTFDAATLKVLGRIHSAGDIEVAAGELHAAGLDNFNLDLMFALPGQSRAAALADLQAALALGPAHLSHYQLTLEPGTPYAARPPPRLPDDDLAWDMQRDCHELLAARGYAHYEISGFARPGRHCVHNLNYWQFGDYLGAGAGAHGKLSWVGRAAIERSTQLREPRRYQAAPVTGLVRRDVAERDLPFEFALNALRLIDGFDLSLFTTRTGLGADCILPQLHALAARELVNVAGQRWRATELGLRFLNDVLEAFLPAPISQVGTEA
ncbi:MAG TPA: radical SAM family heme chaperone HemW [Steroidobacteraceae bacterium]|nr:radical SAM family heme chaperone HemW [Steroidobacteraceae bacterium]